MGDLGFIAVPAWLILSPELSHRAKYVYILLLQHGDFVAQDHASAAAVAKELNLQEDFLIDGLSELLRFGLVSNTDKGLQRVTAPALTSVMEDGQ